MKHLLASLLFIMAISVAQAQGGFQRRTPEERMQMVHQKIDSAFKLEKSKLDATDSVFLKYYKAQDAIFEEMRNGGGMPDREAMQAKMQPLMEDRDKSLKAILTDDQYKTWKDQIEPSMRPQRRQQ